MQSIVKPSSKVIDQQFKENRIMNEENVKIAKIKKSCRVGKIVSIVLFAVFAVLAVVCLAGGIKIWNMGKEFDDMINSATLSGVVSSSDEFGTAGAVSINMGSVPVNMHSDIPAVQAAIDDHPIAVVWSTWILSSSLFTAIGAVIFLLLGSVFSTIAKEATPFTAKVKKRVTTSLIITSVILFLTSGTAYGAICLVVTWVVNAILNYGMTLQVQADETL